MISIRGAITTENTKEDIIESTKILLTEIIQVNGIETEDIISIMFTATQDLTKAAPAAAAREMGILNAALMCLSEMKVEDSLRKCIRVQLNAEVKDISQNQAKHIYLRKARSLRPDLEPV